MLLRDSLVLRRIVVKCGGTAKAWCYIRLRHISRETDRVARLGRCCHTIIARSISLPRATYLGWILNIFLIRRYEYVVIN